MSDMTFECPGCKAQFEVSSSMIGQKTECPSCKMAFVVPSEGRTNGIKFKPKSKTPVPRRGSAPRKKKGALVKFAAMLVLSAVAIVGAIKIGIGIIENAKSEQQAKAERKNRLKAMEVASDESEREAWNDVLKVYGPALKDSVQVDDAMAAIDKFIADNPDSKKIGSAELFLKRLSGVKERQAKLERGKELKNQREANNMVNKLIEKAQEFVHNQEYTKAYNLLAEYDGPLVDETRERRLEELETIREKRNEQLAQAKAEKEAMIQEKIDAIVKEVVASRSYKPLLKAMDSDINESFPEVTKIVQTVFKANGIIKNYYKNNVGKVTELTYSRKVRKAKILKADGEQLSVMMLINGKKFTTKIKYKNLALTDRFKALKSVNAETAALYGAISALKDGDEEQYILYSEDAGPFASVLAQQL